MNYIKKQINYKIETKFIADTYVFNSIQVGEELKKKLAENFKTKRAKSLYEIFVDNIK